MLQRTRIFSADYFVVTKRRRRLREWSWEIQRRLKPLGIRLSGDGFKSEFAAKLAGEKALRELLDGLAQEDKVWLSQKLRGRIPYRLPYRRADAANKTSGFAQTIALCRGGGWGHAESMLESTVSFPAIFFAAIIGVIVFIALSELLLDPHE
jgi:hypothetical protein